MWGVERWKRKYSTAWHAQWAHLFQVGWFSHFSWKELKISFNAPQEGKPNRWTCLQTTQWQVTISPKGKRQVRPKKILVDLALENNAYDTKSTFNKCHLSRACFINVSSNKTASTNAEDLCPLGLILLNHFFITGPSRILGHCWALFLSVSLIFGLFQIISSKTLKKYSINHWMEAFTVTCLHNSFSLLLFKIHLKSCLATE